jgi:hypothetical protein
MGTSSCREGRITHNVLNRGATASASRRCAFPSGRCLRMRWTGRAPAPKDFRVFGGLVRRRSTPHTSRIHRSRSDRYWNRSRQEHACLIDIIAGIPRQLPRRPGGCNCQQPATMRPSRCRIRFIPTPPQLMKRMPRKSRRPVVSTSDGVSDQPRYWLS